MALQGSAQAFVTGSLTRQSVSCYVRAGTLSSATISMTGTGNGKAPQRVQDELAEQAKQEIGRAHV